MKVEITRQNAAPVVTIANGAALSDVIDMRQFAGGVVSMPSSWTTASIGFKHSAAPNGTFQPMYDKSGTLVAVSVAASGEYALPVEVFGCAYVKLWSETSGADVNQSADRSITLSLKG